MLIFKLNVFNNVGVYSSVSDSPIYKTNQKKGTKHKYKPFSVVSSKKVK